MRIRSEADKLRIAATFNSRMPADFFIDTQLGVVFSKAAGLCDRAAIMDHMERLRHHPDFRPEFKQLFDFREVRSVDLSSEDIQVLAMQTVFSERSPRALVVSSDIQFGLGRMFEAYRDLEGERGIMVFREMNEALSWLSLSAEPDPKLFAELGAPDI